MLELLVQPKLTLFVFYISVRQLSFETQLLASHYHSQSVIRLIDCLFSVDLLAPAHHSLSNSSHGSSYYYLSDKKSFLSLIRYQYRSTLLFCTHIRVQCDCYFSWFPPAQRLTLDSTQERWFRTENPSGFSPYTQLELSRLVYHQMSPSFMY